MPLVIKYPRQKLCQLVTLPFKLFSHKKQHGISRVAYRFPAALFRNSLLEKGDEHKSCFMLIREIFIDQNYFQETTRGPCISSYSRSEKHKAITM